MEPNTRVNIDNDIKFILTVKIHIRPEQVLEFFSHFKPIYEVVVAEPKCRYFVVGQDLQTPGAIWWCEGWSENVDWFLNVSYLATDFDISDAWEMEKTPKTGSSFSRFIRFK